MVIFFVQFVEKSNFYPVERQYTYKNIEHIHIEVREKNLNMRLKFIFGIKNVSVNAEWFWS